MTVYARRLLPSSLITLQGSVLVKNCVNMLLCSVILLLDSKCPKKSALALLHDNCFYCSLS